jgi:beta-N-acetylhexosaminidase
MTTSHLMLAFEGTAPSAEILEAIQHHHLSGVSLFRPLNVHNAAQVRELTAALQTSARAAGLPPLLIAADHETGQLLGLGSDLTNFPGNMALAAIGDAALAEQVGRAMGLEMAALGVNINYAPVCDVNSNPANPSIGIRALGDNPQQAAELASALIRGMQSAGIAATAKHFPGLGETAVDSHHAVPVVPYTLGRLEAVEFPPFRAAIGAGVKMMMTGHVALPALAEQPDLPATLSRAIQHDLLRGRLGFEGVLISDAMEMGAIAQGMGQVLDAIAALRAGVDLLLLNSDTAVWQLLRAGLVQAASRGLLDAAELATSQQRIRALQTWLGQQLQPSLEVVGCTAHQQLAREVATRALTLVRDEAGLLPLRLPREANIGVVIPQPIDLTPADTSSYEQPDLAAELRPFYPHTTQFTPSHHPTADEISSLRAKLADCDLLIIGTISAHLNFAQAEMARALLALGRPTITVSLRTPYDLATYPEAQTHICTYSLLPPSISALADGLVGRVGFEGKLPVGWAEEQRGGGAEERGV